MIDDSIQISVVIGFKDWGIDRLSGAVRSIQKSLGSINSEVIVADYGSITTEGYRKALEDIGAVYRYIPTDGTWSRSRALNAGLQIARGQYLVTTDADMVFSPQSFPRILELLESQPRTSFILQCRDLPEGIDQADILQSNFDWNWLEAQSRLRPRWGMGGMIAFDRGAYEALRGLDERMEIYGGEDIDLAKRLLRIGYKRMWIDDPAVRMYHVWHPSSRVSADDTIEGKAAIHLNRDIHLNDKSIIRNLKDWKGRPESADPLVTVAISTFNRAEYLEDSINSVIGQTFQDCELIIVDDGSTDNTVEVLSKFDDPRIRIISQENRGLAAARNLITRQARGRYIAVHDDDDIMLPWSLEVRLAALTSGVHGSYGGWIDYDNTSGQRKFNIGKKLSIESLLFNNSTYLHPTLLVETKVLRQIPYNESMRSGSDFNLAVRMIRSGIKLNHSTHYVLLRRLHEGQITNSDSVLQKVSGVLTNFMARSNMTSADIDGSRTGRHEKDKAIISASQAVAETYVTPFMPDHLVTRSVKIAEEISVSDIGNYDPALPLESFWLNGEQQKIELAADYGKISLRHLFDVYRTYSTRLNIIATEVSSEENAGEGQSFDSGLNSIAEPDPILRKWFAERVLSAPAGVYVAVEQGPTYVADLLSRIDKAGERVTASEPLLIGGRGNHCVYRLQSVGEIDGLIDRMTSSGEGISSRHLIIDKKA